MCERELPPKNLQLVRDLQSPLGRREQIVEKTTTPNREASVENAARAPHRSPLASNTLSNARKSKRGA